MGAANITRLAGGQQHISPRGHRRRAVHFRAKPPLHRGAGHRANAVSSDAVYPVLPNIFGGNLSGCV